VDKTRFLTRLAAGPSWSPSWPGQDRSSRGGQCRIVGGRAGSERRGQRQGDDHRAHRGPELVPLESPGEPDRDRDASCCRGTVQFKDGNTNVGDPVAVHPGGVVMNGVQVDANSSAAFTLTSTLTSARTR
jgi:hypothetical protein